jgi:hypothetical protein
VLRQLRGKSDKQRGKFSSFFKMSVQFFPVKIANLLIFYNTYFLNGLEKPALTVEKVGSRFTPEIWQVLRCFILRWDRIGTL